MPNFRKTTDGDCTVGISASCETTIEINVSLHPFDIDRLHTVLANFLATCEKTNSCLAEFEKEYNEYHVDFFKPLASKTDILIYGQNSVKKQNDPNKF